MMQLTIIPNSVCQS